MSLLLFGKSNDTSLSYTNLISSFGGCESTVGWSFYQSTLAIDSANKLDGTNCIKQTINATKTEGQSYRDVLPLIDKSKYYLVSAYVKNGNCSTGIRVKVNCYNDVGVVSSDYNIATSYVRKGVVLQPSQIDAATQARIHADITGAEGQYAYFDNFMVNEITPTDFSAGVDFCLNKYPFKP